MNRAQTGYYFRKGMDPREQQIQAMDWWDSVRKNGVKCKKIAGPTGTGKTLLADAIAKREENAGRKISIVTGTILLQDQYKRELPEYPVLMGASNYDCVCFPGNTCAMTRQMEQLMDTRPGGFCEDQCPYTKARSDCYASPYAIFNIMSYFFFAKWGEADRGIRKHVTDLVIVDEFQMVASMLNSLFELVIWEDDIHIPRGTSASIVATYELLKKRQGALSKYLKENIKELKPGKIKVLVDHLAKIDEVSRMLRDESDLFIVQELDRLRYNKMMRCLQIRVVKPMPKVLRHFFAANEVLLMSATALDIDVRELGFKTFDSFEVESPIPVSQREIYVENTALYSFKTQETALPVILKRVEEIVDKLHPGERGIVLTTYRVAKEMRERIKNPRFVFHEQTDKNDVIDSFLKTTSPDTVAVISGQWEGLDLKDDLARFVIIPIFPVDNWTDAVVQKRVQMDQALPVPENWYELQAMKKVIQGSGRASRHAKDKSTIYILDSKFTRAFLKTKSSLPKFFKDAVKWGKR